MVREVNLRLVQLRANWADSEGCAIKSKTCAMTLLDVWVFAVRRVFCEFGLKRRPTNRRNANSAKMTSRYFELFVDRD